MEHEGIAGQWKQVTGGVAAGRDCHAHPWLPCIRLHGRQLRRGAGEARRPCWPWHEVCAAQAGPGGRSAAGSRPATDAWASGAAGRGKAGHRLVGAVPRLVNHLWMWHHRPAQHGLYMGFLSWVAPLLVSDRHILLAAGTSTFGSRGIAQHQKLQSPGNGQFGATCNIGSYIWCGVLEMLQWEPRLAVILLQGNYLPNYLGSN